MARRALRRLKTTTDLSQSLFLLSDLLPSDSEVVCAPLESLFGDTATKLLAKPLELEIGSGKGLFIRLAAAKTPDHCFLGVEAANHYAEYCAQKIAMDGLTNAKMISGDAAIFLRDGVPDNFLWAVHVYFPDPWWKRKQRKRRVMREEVIRLIYQKLRHGGHLHFWTDVSEYFVSTVSLIAQTTAFELLATPVAPDSPQTHFERRTRLAGEPVYRSLYVKPHCIGNMTMNQWLIPDDVATDEDITAHNVAMEEFRRGETVKHDDIDWYDTSGEPPTGVPMHE